MDKFRQTHRPSELIYKEYRSKTKNYSPPITHDLCSAKLCISLKDKWGIHGESLFVLLPFISLKQRWDIHLEFLWSLKPYIYFER
jgi:hypothetical protein